MHVPKMNETDKTLWTNFEAAFKSAWMDTLSTQNMHQQLTSLVMKGDDLLDGTQMQTEQSNSSRETLPTKVQKSNRSDQVVPMDVDNIQTMSGKPAWQTKRTPEEKECCQKEGRCFRCMAQGHLSMKCPKKRTNPNTQKVNNVSTSTPTTQVETTVQEPAKPNVDLRSAILNLDSTARQELISALLLNTAGDNAEFLINTIKSISEQSITVLADVKGTNQKLRLLLDTRASGNFIDRGAA
ncbi:hypothetical protein EDB92DRAFT_1895560 [Lactarius akahatsu]|uniref:CCHC-type domain-containing protein n=1 Tax=Lactarius akahatsu TaxID=416441 RepID=A0AAD4Q997_9AGAM|nr:hypothetical protein EDB92DRAFT_1895560 [Lactarius akahatsu]